MHPLSLDERAACYKRIKRAGLRLPAVNIAQKSYLCIVIEEGTGKVILHLVPVSALTLQPASQLTELNPADLG